MRALITALVVLSLGVAEATFAGTTLEGVRIHESPEYTRVVFDTSRRAQIKWFSLEGPHRVVIDFKNTELGQGFDVHSAAIDRRRITGVRVAPRDSGYRVVFDLPTKLKPNSFTLDPVAPHGNRVVVDLYDAEGAVSRKPVVKPEGRRNVLVAIDAGHGGEDPGALGPNRLQEKHVVLSIARKLDAMLDAQEGYEGFLVRTGDYYIGHDRRREIARKRQAHLFISIHADGFRSPKPSGVSVYAVSQKGATSEQAKFLADRANRSDLIGGVGTVRLDDKDDDVAKTLIDMRMESSLIESLAVGDSILEELGKTAKLHKKQVEQAAFLVLKSPDVASVLVETGFISNPDEARRLNQRDYQQRISRAILDGVTAYFNAHPPAGTLIAWQREQGDTEYTIGRGDTLSGIAVRFGVSTANLKRINGLSNDVIRVGQVLVIPST